MFNVRPVNDLQAALFWEWGQHARRIAARKWRADAGSGRVCLKARTCRGFLGFAFAALESATRPTQSPLGRVAFVFQHFGGLIVSAIGTCQLGGSVVVVACSLICSLWFFAGPYLHSAHFLKTHKTYPRTVDGNAYTTPDAYAYWNYTPPQGCCHLYVNRAKLIIECGAKQHTIDLQARPYQLEIRGGYVLILKPIGGVEGWVLMAVWSRKLDAVAKLLAQRFGWRVIRY